MSGHVWEPDREIHNAVACSRCGVWCFVGQTGQVRVPCVTPPTDPAPSIDSTLRDHFAGLAMQAILTFYAVDEDSNAAGMVKPGDAAGSAYDYADAMMAERERRYGGGK